MKKVPCSSPDCKHRRKHWCSPDEERGVVYVEVEDDYDGPAYCSITCAIMDGAMTLKYEPEKNNG